MTLACERCRARERCWQALRENRQVCGDKKLQRGQMPKMLRELPKRILRHHAEPAQIAAAIHIQVLITKSITFVWPSNVRALIQGHLTISTAQRIANVFFIYTGGWLTGQGHFTFIELETLGFLTGPGTNYFPRSRKNR